MNTEFNQEQKETLDEVTWRLTDPDGLKMVGYQVDTDSRMPSLVSLREVVNLARSVLFPGYFEEAPLRSYNVKYHVGVNLEKLHRLLNDQIYAGLCFAGDVESMAEAAHQRSAGIATEFIRRLPDLREVLTTDVIAAYNGDPAAKSYGEIIFCYPALKAMLNYRIAHELLELGVPLIPRIITELAHSETGIDIHPGAKIGEYFTIDHGTGVVIGETAVIGNNVKLYQGVTLGAKSFPLDVDGNPIKGILRHPIIEDDVVVYSNASILGRVTIGRGSVIGGNVWIANDVPPGSKVFFKGEGTSSLL